MPILYLPNALPPSFPSPFTASALEIKIYVLQSIQIYSIIKSNFIEINAAPELQPLHLATELVILVMLLDQILVDTCACLVAGTQYKVSRPMVTNPNQLVANAIQVHLNL